MLLTYDYDSNYSGPAFPAVEIAIQGFSAQSSEVTCRAWVDSGADATIIPLQLLTRTKARKIDTVRMVALSGPSYRVDLYEIKLRLGPFLLNKVDVIGGKQSGEAILGRDVLNQFIVTLNGLASMVEISQ